jgi:endonuclease-3
VSLTTEREKQEIALLVRERLAYYFPAPPIPLSHTSSYTFLIAVLLSAQCTDERVNKVTPALFALASTPSEMVKLSIEEIQAIIRPCGLSARKAEAIHRLSAILLEKSGGEVIADQAFLESLPGVGTKTAAVVISQIFGMPAFPVDTHIHRLAKRWGLSDGINVMKTQRDLCDLFPKEIWGLLHLQVIYYARAYCPARGHQPNECPICNELAQRFPHLSFPA